MSEPQVVSRGLQRAVRCRWCEKRFIPHVRQRERQQTCGEAACRRKHRAAYQRRYRRVNGQAEAEYRAKRREQLPAGYWKAYRASRPEALVRNRVASKLRKRLGRAGLQRKLDIVQVFEPPGYFDEFRGFAMRHQSLIEEGFNRSAA